MLFLHLDGLLSHAYHIDTLGKRTEIDVGSITHMSHLQEGTCRVVDAEYAWTSDFQYATLVDEVFLLCGER